jgi:hypothetical protein
MPSARDRAVWGNPARRIASGAVFALLLMLLGAADAGANHSLRERLSKGPNGGNAAIDAGYGGTSSDGSVVTFITTEQLVTTDTDTSVDVYQRSGSTTTLISVGPNGGNGAYHAGFDGASADGSRVFFHTLEQLVSTDTDTTNDVYERSGGTTTIASQGTIGGNGSNDAFFVGNNADGSRIWFVSYEKLLPEDADTMRKDLYERSGGTLKLLSLGPAGGGGPYSADWAGASQDGSRVFFTTDEQLTTDDTDSTWKDIYERSGTTTSLVSTGPNGGGGAYAAFYGGASSNGSKVWFRTQESLVASDTDSACPDGAGAPVLTCSDVYERSSGTTTLISTSPTSTNAPYNANFGGASTDGSRVFFTTAEALVAGDIDGGCNDVLGNPTSNCADVYERSGGSTTWLSTSPTNPNTAHNANFAGASKDGSRVFFETPEKLENPDTDTVRDVYERAGGATTRISTSSTGGNGGYPAQFLGASDDGQRVFFQTYEPMTLNDTDPPSGSLGIDIYERFVADTTLISTGPTSPNSDSLAQYEGRSADGTRVVFTTAEPLVSDDTDANEDVYVATASAFDRPAQAMSLQVALTVGFRQTINATQCAARSGVVSSHGPPLAFDSCNPPAYATGTRARIGPTGSASASLTAVPGNLGTPADEADVAIAMNASDVRAISGGGDYVPVAAGPDVTLVQKWRLTDRQNGPATMVDFEFPVPVNCVATAGPEGSNCDVATSADAVMAGAIVEGKDMLIANFRVRVNDAGVNAVRGDADDRLFLMQGIYIP